MRARIGNSAESSPGIRVFKGIPFAAPPVGALRWAAPQPVAKWDGVRDASKFGDVCIQPAGPTTGPGARLNIAVLPDSPPLSEDCLYLNVWTGAASASERRPVMVYFFGGAFTEGSGSVPLYDGDALARKGAVVVTMNYRLGPYGFFVHPALTAESPHKASGNYGLMDMLASLRWVQSNIAAFGGDPNNVTVFGQSAGAMAIASLVASPEAKGLMHRAISQSGAWMGLGPAPGMRTRAQAEEVGLKAATEAGVTTLEQLRAMSAADVTEKFRSAGMIVDGWVIPEDPSITFAAGRQNAVDVLVGSNKDEAFFPAHARAQQFEEQARARWGCARRSVPRALSACDRRGSPSLRGADLERRHVLAHASVRGLSSASAVTRRICISSRRIRRPPPASRRSPRRMRPRCRTSSTTSASCRCSRIAAIRSSRAHRRRISRSRIRCRRTG